IPGTIVVASRPRTGTRSGGTAGPSASGLPAQPPRGGQAMIRNIKCPRNHPGRAAERDMNAWITPLYAPCRSGRGTSSLATRSGSVAGSSLHLDPLARRRASPFSGAVDIEIVEVISPLYRAASGRRSWDSLSGCRAAGRLEQGGGDAYGAPVRRGGV